MEINEDLMQRLLDYFRQRCAESGDLWAANILRQLEEISDRDRQRR